MFSIDKMSRTPIYEQLIEQFELGILSGEIDRDGQLPSVRSLSQQLGVNPNTLQRAYAEIERRGLCYTVPGSGRYITGDALLKLKQHRSARLVGLGELIKELFDSGVPKSDIEAVVNGIYDDETTKKEEVKQK